MADKWTLLDYSHFEGIQRQERQSAMCGKIVNRHKKQCIQLSLSYFLLGTVLLPLRT